MYGTKYGKYFAAEDKLRNTSVNPKNASPKALMESGALFSAGNCTINWECVCEPYVMDPVPHYHEFDEYLCFMGSNIHDIFDFDAEIEVYVGEEGEKHIIKSATVFYIPAGLIHCPFIFKRVGKPFMFNIVAHKPDYFTRLGDYRTYTIREGERDKTISGMKEIIRQNYSPIYAESLKAFLKELENDDAKD